MVRDNFYTGFDIDGNENGFLCPYCNMRIEKPIFAVTYDVIRNRFKGDTSFDSKKNSFIDSTLKTTLTGYGISATDDECIRAVFDPERIPAFVEDWIIVRREDEVNDGRHIAINGYVADITNESGIPVEPVSTIACEKCHLILPNEYATRDFNSINNYTITLLGAPGGSKTALAISLYNSFKEIQGAIDIVEPFFLKYYRNHLKNLSHGTAPESTKESITPSLTINLSHNGISSKVHIMDTAGENIKDEEKNWSRNLAPGLRADLLLILIDREDKRKSGDLYNYILDLRNRLLNRGRKTKVIICFSKCDRYPNHAKEYMIADYRKWEREIRRENKGLDYNALMDLRKYRITDTDSYFMNPEFYKGERIEPESDAVAEEENPVTPEAGASNIRAIRAEANAISGNTTKYVIIAPFGTTVKDQKLQGAYSPQYIDDLIETLKIYGGIK
ncbi:MAG: GTPase domain-containing protein [Ruminococcus sp.]|nr:GTPase domain-containing protein [Ruminococcus sp.]